MAGFLGFRLALSMSEEVKLKECHKTEEQKELERVQKLRVGVEYTIKEYLLIKQKKSDLPRAGRGFIERKINRLIRDNVLTEDELNLIKQ